MKCCGRFVWVVMHVAVLNCGCIERDESFQIQDESLQGDGAAREDARRGEPAYPIETAPLAAEQRAEPREASAPQTTAAPRTSAAEEGDARARESAEQAERRAVELDAEVRAAREQIKELERRLRKQEGLIEDLRDESAKARRDRDRYREKYEREKRRRRS